MDLSMHASEGGWGERVHTGDGAAAAAGGGPSTSGAMYSGVPQAVLQSDSRLPSLLYPKSHSLSTAGASPCSSMLSSCAPAPAPSPVPPAALHSAGDGFDRGPPTKWTEAFGQTA